MKAAAQRPVRIGLLGMYTRHNLGDTAIVRRMMTELRARIPACEFIGITRNPEEAVEVHGIAAMHSTGYGASLRADGSPWTEVEHPAPRWLPFGVGTRRLITVARQLDLLLMTGGGQLEDFFGGANSQPRALLTWTLLARLRRIPSAFFAVGVDGLTRRSSRLLCVNAVRLADFRSFREAGSVDILRAAGLRADCRVDPDPALGLDCSAFSSADGPRSPLVVVSPISFRTWTEQREASYDRYLHHLVAACEAWIRAGKRVRFLCSDIQMDPPVARQLIASIAPELRAQCEFLEVDTVEGFLRGMAGARFAVASRLHAAIFALTTATPLIAISPARKVTRLMADAELAPFCPLIEQLDEQTLAELSARIEREQEPLRAQIRALTARCRGELAAAYDELVRLLPALDRAKASDSG